MRKQPIYVVGYPRSGNTWLSRLLGDVLNSPVEGYLNAKPLATEGQDRDGKYVVRQLHLKPHDGSESDPMLTAWSLNINKWNGDPIVYIMRDPRDVCVSAMFYWDISTIEKAVNAVGGGLWPLTGVGKWTAFVDMWDVFPFGMHVVTYEQLHGNPFKEINSIVKDYLGEHCSGELVRACVSRQSFSEKKATIEHENGVDRPYGKEAQLKHLRHGKVGDWKTYFTSSATRYAYQHFHNHLIKFGYEPGKGWLEGRT